MESPDVVAQQKEHPADNSELPKEDVSAQAPVSGTTDGVSVSENESVAVDSQTDPETQAADATGIEDEASAIAIASNSASKAVDSQSGPELQAADTTDAEDEASAIELETDDGSGDEPGISTVPEEEESGEPLNTAGSEARQSVGYTGEITGKVYKVEDLQSDPQAQEEKENQRAAMLDLIEGTLTEVSEQEIVQGKVVSIGEKEVGIDIGFKSDGIVAKNEFVGELELGQDVEVFLERIEDYHGQLVLSKTRADKVRRWQFIEKAFENETIVEGTVIRRIKGGMIVELLDELEAFLPGSQIDVRPVRDFDAYLERRMEFKIVKINAINENVVVSHKALIQKDLATQRESILSTMEAGQVLEGIVKNITDFGVFVDLGGVDGLLHITDLSWGRVTHPSEVLNLDAEVKVVVLEYDRERQRISLGYKQLQPHPWDNILDRYSEGGVVEGKVVSITDYGTFVELEKGVEGLVHISEMSWTDHIRHPSQKVSLGQMVTVAILSIDHEAKKISLGMKQFEQNPWDGIADRYPPGTVLSGAVRNITTFGVFVEIEPGIDGLVHISDLSWTKKIRHPGELVRKRQELSVVVLEIDEPRQRISLGHKQIETNPWTDLAAVYEEGTDHKVKVITVDDKGLQVELPLEVEAFVPIGELRNGRPNIFRAYRVGDTLELRVTRMDVAQKEILMSEVAKERAEARLQRVKEKMQKQAVKEVEEQAMQEYKKQTKEASGPTTLGELSGLAALRDQMAAAERKEKRLRKRKKKEAEVEQAAQGKVDEVEETAQSNADEVEQTEQSLADEVEQTAQSNADEVELGAQSNADEVEQVAQNDADDQAQAQSEEQVELSQPKEPEDAEQPAQPDHPEQTVQAAQPDEELEQPEEPAQTEQSELPEGKESE